MKTDRSTQAADLELQPKRSLRILILTRHYPPDVGAPSYRLEHVSEVLSQQHDVTVITAQPNRYRGLPGAPTLERSGRLTIRRIWNARILEQSGKFGRVVTEVVGAAWMACVALWFCRGIDVVLVSSPPLFYLFPGWLLAKVCSKRLVLDIRDFWLDWAAETRLVKSPLLMWLLRSYERAVIRSAQRVTVTTKSFRSLLQRRYALDPDRITVIYNGLDAELAPQHAVKPSHSSDGPHRVVYAGNLGPSQHVLAVADGILSSLDRWPNLEFLIVGDGMQWEALNALDHDRLTVLKHIGREELAAIYRRADSFFLHLAALEVYKHTVPSKVFEYAAYGKPILCGVTGEALAICRQHTDVFEFASEDSASLGAAIDRLLAHEKPDNYGEPRADHSDLFREVRDPLWMNVFASF